MLRGAVLGFAILLVALGLAGLFAEPSTWPFLLMALLVLAGTLFERARYGAARAAPVPGVGWQPTPERFVDETGQAVRVWFNPVSGERRYVADDSAPGQRD